MADSDTVQHRAEEAVLDESTVEQQDEQAPDPAKLLGQVEDMERILNEERSLRRKAENEAKKLAEERLNRQDELMSKLTDVVASKGNDGSQEQAAERLQQMEEILKDGDPKDVLNVIREFSWSAQSGAIEEVKKLLESQASKEQEEIQSLKAQLASLSTSTKDLDPEYRRRKEHVAELAEKYGKDVVADRELLMAISKDMKPDLGTPQREVAPGSSAGAAVKATVDVSKITTLPPHMVSLARDMGWSEEDALEFYKEREARKNAS